MTTKMQKIVGLGAACAAFAALTLSACSNSPDCGGFKYWQSRGLHVPLSGARAAPFSEMVWLSSKCVCWTTPAHDLIRQGADPDSIRPCTVEDGRLEVNTAKEVVHYFCVAPAAGM